MSRSIIYVCNEVLLRVKRTRCPDEGAVNDPTGPLSSSVNRPFPLRVCWLIWKLLLCFSHFGLWLKVWCDCRKHKRCWKDEKISNLVFSEWFFWAQKCAYQAQWGLSAGTDNENQISGEKQDWERNKEVEGMNWSLSNFPNLFFPIKPRFCFYLNNLLDCCFCENVLHWQSWVSLWSPLETDVSMSRDWRYWVRVQQQLCIQHKHV